MTPALVDFHNHFVGALPSEAPAKWPLLADAQAFERSLEDVGARVLSTPLEFVPGVPASRINDAIAGLAQRHRGKVIGLASVDAYAGAAAAEADRERVARCNAQELLRI